MKHQKTDGFDWLDDPFKPDSAPKPSLSSGAKRALGIGCALVVLLIIIALVLSVGVLAQLSASL